MIAIFISWLIASFVILSAGDMFVLIYNKLAKSEDNYSSIETLLLGLCFICITLPLSSFWLPSNQYILGFYIITSIIYWGIRRQRLYNRWKLSEKKIKSLKPHQLFLICIFTLGFLVFVSYLSINPDSILYHYQNIHLNETYKVIPGIANIEDRFGFNSNYLLISSIFSFRFLFGESLYPLQSFLFVYLGIWLFIQSIIQRKILYTFTIILLLFILLTNLGISNTSTDIIPTLITFCYVLSLIISKDRKNNTLFVFIVPIALITYKLSMAPLCLISLVLLIRLIKKRQISKIIPLLSFSFLILLLWCTRNVIISGYLVYPLNSIDIFSFDWKVPKEVSILQDMYIHDWSRIVQYNNFSDLISIAKGNTPLYKIILLEKMAYPILYILTVISFFIFGYSKVKYRSSNLYLDWLFISLCLGLIINLILAPDSRFYIGFILAIILEGGYYLILILKKNNTQLPYAILNSINTLVVISFIFITYKYQRNLENVFHKVQYNISEAILFPIDPLKINNAEIPLEKYKLNDNIDIYLTNEFSAPLEYIPFTNSIGIPYSPFYGKKIQSIKTVEARGLTIQDGFRTKKSYIELFKLNRDKYKAEYEEALIEKVKQEGILKIKE